MNKNGYPETSIECKITFCKDCCNFIKFDSKLHICPKAEKVIEQAIKRAIETESLFDLFKDDKKRNSYYARVAQLLFHMFRGCSNFENLDCISQQSRDFAEFAAINEVYKRIAAKRGEMSYFEVQINSSVAEIRNGEPHIFRFEEHKHKEDDLRKLYWAYNNQAHWLVEASKYADSVYHKARLFGKAAYAMRQAIQVKHWEEIRNRKRGEKCKN